jgi:hypothetical protein
MERRDSAHRPPGRIRLRDAPSATAGFDEGAGAPAQHFAAAEIIESVYNDEVLRGNGLTGTAIAVSLS